MVWGSRGSGAPGYLGLPWSLKDHYWREIKREIHISEFCFSWSQNRFVPINFSKLPSSTSALSANKVSSVCLSWSPVDPSSTPTCSPPPPLPPPSLSHSFANLSLLLLLLTHHKCTCTPFLLNVVPQSISCGLISNFATGFQNSLFALIQTFTKVVNSETMGQEDHLVSFYHCMPGSHQLCHWHLWVIK